MPRYDLNGDLISEDAGAASPPSATASEPEPATYGTFPAPVSPRPTGGPSLPYTGSPFAQPQQPYMAGQFAQSPPVLPLPARSTVDPVRMIWAITIAVLVVTIGIVVLVEKFPARVPAPSNYSSYTFDNGAVIDRPVGWAMTPIDKTQGSDAVKILGGAEFRNGTAMIEVAEGTPYDTNMPVPNNKHGILGAMITSTLNQQALDIPPAESTAKRYRRLAKNHLWGYRTIKTQYIGESKAYKYVEQETFTADHPAWNVGGPIKGYFVAEADGVDSIAIVCECREKDWSTLQPAFDHIVASLDNPELRRSDEQYNAMMNSFENALRQPSGSSTEAPSN